MNAGFWDDVEPADHPRTRVEARLGRFPWPMGSTSAGLYQSHGWLAAMERISPDATRYVLATDGDRLLGVLPVYLLDPLRAGHYHPSLAFGLTDESGGPVAVLGGRAGYLTRWMLTDSADARARTLTALLITAADVAIDHGARFLTAVYLPASDAALLARTGLVRRDEVIPHSAQATMDLVGSSFDDYLHALSASRRSAVRRDLARFAASGLSIRACRLSAAMDFAPALLASVLAKHGGRADVDRMRSALSHQVATLDSASTVIMAAAAVGGPVAYSLSYACDDTLFVRLAGLDHDRAAASAAYFVTTYYETIRHAYRLGLSRVHFGIASYRPKVLRGAALSPLYGLLRGPNCAPLAGERRAAVVTWLCRSLHHDLGSLAPPAAMFSPVDWSTDDRTTRGDRELGPEERPTPTPRRGGT